MNELMVWLQDLWCQTEDDMNFLVGGSKNYCQQRHQCSGWKWMVCGQILDPNVRRDIVRKVSSSSFYWCQNNRVVLVQNNMINFFKGLKQRCQRQFLALPRLDDMVPGVCRKWGIPFSLVEARTEIWKFYFGRIMYITLT